VAIASVCIHQVWTHDLNFTRNRHLSVDVLISWRCGLNSLAPINM